MFASDPAFAQATSRTVFEWGRIESNADWLLPLAVAAAVACFARYMIRRDARELSPRMGWLFTALRLAAIACLLAIYLEPQWRAEREEARNSRAVLLVDTSSSMGMADERSPFAPDASSRLEHVIAALRTSEFVERLRAVHDVLVLGFDEDLRRVASFDKLEDPSTSTAAAIDWHDALAPKGMETRLGQVLRQAIQGEAGAPVSGIGVLSDGGQNAGIPVEVAVAAAREAKVPIFAVGVGSTRGPTNVRVHQLEVPPQAHPGDPYTVTGLIQAEGLAGESATVEWLVRPSDEGAASLPASGVVVHREEIVLGSDGEVVPVKFELTPTETGRRMIGLRVQAPQADSDPSDDFQEEEVEIVDRQIRVLLLAGGPTREYRFLRSLLFRDRSTTLDVLLQSGPPGISQEADRILDAFPVDRGEMFAYDCLVAFDPDWQTLTQEQVDLLESWVADQGGGLIVIAGPVHAGEAIAGWIENEGMAKVRALYPVEFERHRSVFETTDDVSSEPWPLDFTREGLEAGFLQLGDSAVASRQAWAEMGGVFRFFPVEGPKPGAKVLAHFSDPEAARGGRPPVYMAEQFYGSGRVFYLGSGEMWRLRRADEGHFERLYTRLIGYVSQGRLLRQSSRGALMVGRDRSVLGDTVEIRARLTNAQFEPLVVSGVTANVFAPEGGVETLTLSPDPNRAGMYAGHLAVLREGTYRLEVPIPESDEQLVRRIKVQLPDLERRSSRRNDKLLSQVARATGGVYYPSLEAAFDPEAADPLVERFKDRSKTIIQTAGLDPPSLRWLVGQTMPRLAAQRWFAWLVDESWLARLAAKSLLWWLMVATCGFLCVEWLIRRLANLA